MKNKNSKKIYIMLKCKWLLTLQRNIGKPVIPCLIDSEVLDKFLIWKQEKTKILSTDIVVWKKKKYRPRFSTLYPPLSNVYNQITVKLRGIYRCIRMYPVNKQKE
jgi:hypothetical protein